MGMRVNQNSIFAVLAVLALLAGCGGSESQPKKIQPPEQNNAPAPIHAAAVWVRRGHVRRPLMLTGTAPPRQEANVGTKVAGRIERIFVEEGAEVREGETLFRMDQSDLVLTEKAARASLAMAGASLNETVLTLESAAREKERFSRLYEKNAVSRQKLDDVTTAHALAESRVDLGKARLAEAEANLALLLQRLHDSVIVAPFSGVVVKKFVNEAEIVSPGVPVITLMNIDRVKAEVEIPETSLTAVKPGTPVAVAFDALPGGVFRGAVSRLNPRINRQSRAFKAEIDIANPGRRIKPGMFARITIATEAVRNVIVIPQQALVVDERGNASVFAIRNDRAVLLAIKTGLTGEGLVEVREGLTMGDRVVVGGNYGMGENTLVNTRIVPY